MGLLKPLLKDISIGNRILPSLALRFADNTYQLDSGTGLEDKTFADIITFTRASGGGRFNASGVYEWLGNDVPRLDYDPATLQPKGLLIEEQRTNLLTYSEKFDNAAWAKNAGVVVQPGAALAPDGTASAAKISGMQAAAGDRITRTVAQSSPITATNSVWVRADGGDVGKTVIFSIRRDTGTVAEAQVVVTLTGVWQRVQATLTMLPDNSGLRFIFMRGTADSFYSWGAQLEAGAFPTSYIPTVASQVTRSADVASVNTLSPWYNASEGALYFEGASFGLGTGSASYAAALTDNSINEVITIRRSATGFGGAVIDNGAAQAEFAPTYSNGAITKIALAFKANDFALSKDGAAALTDTSGSIPTVDRLNIGATAILSAHLNGHIRNISYYPRAYSGIVLQEMT